MQRPKHLPLLKIPSGNKNPDRLTTMDSNGNLEKLPILLNPDFIVAMYPQRYNGVDLWCVETINGSIFYFDDDGQKYINGVSREG